MARLREWRAGMALLMIVGRLTCAHTLTAPFPALCCSKYSAKDWIFALPDSTCSIDEIKSSCSTAVIEGDEKSLQRALDVVHRRSHDYVALLFYASWCPFSRKFKPIFSVVSSLLPWVPHFAIEESAIKPSTLSKYGVIGFPTLFLMNSTMRFRYHGSRSLDSLVDFYGDLTEIGAETSSKDNISLDKIRCSSNKHRDGGSEQESCPFSWSRSPQNFLRQETYLALATAFVLMRLLYVIFPAVCRFSRASRRCILNLRTRSSWEYPQLCPSRAVQFFNSLKEPCKRSNLQEGAMNAKAWASKSLASVSIGDASSSRAVAVSSTH
ncbi:PREDICTED: 5'-adenylylsulfate reductase-like 4 isoform X1 [Ipomoea nil]|uniref:5'-adenylylsulfate reductase-like 4 isoform X1 n=1 Tax=Ipomoea nil TaxID=35883 RepID=UPI000900D9BB|nr:PREDICTED: 5'-adenylylsulfate reductase-like 4 isoform X1 [Ipomoea nil]